MNIKYLIGFEATVSFYLKSLLCTTVIKGKIPLDKKYSIRDDDVIIYKCIAEAKRLFVQTLINTYPDLVKNIEPELKVKINGYNFL